MSTEPDRAPLFPDLLTTGDVARMFRVSPATVNRWANRGLLTARKTLGGHRRYDGAQVRALLGPPGE